MPEPAATINLPGWEDIFSIPKPGKPSASDYREYRAALRAGREPALPPETIAELERRNRIRSKIQSSAAPPAARAWTQIMTWLDDSQDLFALLKFGGRIAAWGFPRIIGRIAPGLGWILLASDILQLLTMLAMLIQPFFVGLCEGFGRLPSAILPPLLMGSAAKLAKHGISGINPFSRRAILKRTQKFAGKLFRFGELLEIGQAMKTLTGYGLTLGGLMGALTESAYAIELLLRGKPVDIGIAGGYRISIRRDGITTSGPLDQKALKAYLESIAIKHLSAVGKAQELAAQQTRQ